MLEGNFLPDRKKPLTRKTLARRAQKISWDNACNAYRAGLKKKLSDFSQLWIPSDLQRFEESTMAWTEITCRHYRREGLRYGSDTTDAEGCDGAASAACIGARASLISRP